MFIDEVRIYVKGGDGGDGCISFRRERFIPRGGPNGGDGGKGGDVIICANKNIDTLLDITSKVKFIAEDGGKGQNTNKTGKNGKDLVVHVPKGTLIKDLKTGRIIKDLKENDTSIKIARGGRKGRGNAYFKSPTDQTPRIAEEGRNGQERWLRLELKLIADIGIIGLPNAGKSTFLSSISSARPKIADYPFTTLQPQLGIVELEDYKRLVFADIPGLIEGAHSGSGLGNTFLRHIERTRVVVHLIDISSSDLLKTYNLVRNELALFSSKLSEKAEIVALNKSDILDMESSRIIAEDLSKKISKPVHVVSAVSGNNVKSLIKSAADLIDKEKEREEELSYLSLSTDKDPIGKKGLTF
jgi:GTP-binding protein